MPLKEFDSEIVVNLKNLIGIKWSISLLLKFGFKLGTNYFYNDYLYCHHFKDENNSYFCFFKMENEKINFPNIHSTQNFYYYNYNIKLELKSY